MIGSNKNAKQSGWIAIIGGIFQLIYGILAIFFPYSPGVYYGWDEGLWILANIGMAGAIFGILILNVGKPDSLTRLSGIAAIIGVFTRIIASIFIIMRSSWDPLPIILLSILLILGGMFALGIAILRGNKIKGWQSWTPILVSIFGFIVAALFSVSLFIHFILLGFWGVFWMLIGYVVISYVPENLTISN
ncbi:MAG: hypothetical protein OEZ01_04200 [Candidatus Heimdallarchaeota archaeon]|nr:hypothetical protein [Candidatus Heimdallarchaeota archaeon]MDH5645182.1 hypothetical protein [Candidatus Heimdallarchaeota archaeon]